jgi:hypothetical protein
VHGFGNKFEIVVVQSTDCCIFAVANGFDTIKIVNIVMSLLLGFSKTETSLSDFLRTGSELCCFFSITADSFKLWPPVVYDHKKYLIRLAVAEFRIVVDPKTVERHH